MAESIAYDLFKEYTGENAAQVLSSLPNSEPVTYETTWREFKSGFIKDEDFNYKWSEILGAFANTDGGVLVWGIYAASDQNSKIDAVKNIQPVEKPEAFVTRLKRTAKDAINPPLHGVEMEPVFLEDGSGKGFAVCYIPQGNDKPYESLHCKERFIGRFDDRCERLPLSFVKQLFYPQYNPILQVEFQPNITPHSPVQMKMRNPETGNMDEAYTQWIEINIRNVGEVSLIDGCIRIESEGILFWEWRPKSSGELEMDSLPSLSERGTLHPQLRFQFRLICCRLTPIKQATFTFTVYGNDMSPRKASLAVPNFKAKELIIAQLAAQ